MRRAVWAFGLGGVACGPDTVSPPDEAFATNTVHYPARQRTQLFSGWHAEEAGKTWVVYAAGEIDGQSACAPWISELDHASGRWDAGRPVFDSPVAPDAHNYPQLLVDSTGHLHVLQSFHANHPIRHATSSRPHDPSAWSITDVPDTSGATYGAAFASDAGAFYLLFRHRDNAPGEADYEPEYVTKSLDEGQTWTRTKLIDPVDPQANTGWGTVYVKSTHYATWPDEGLHLVFGIHEDHNQALDAHYYVFFRFADDHLVTARGEVLGHTVDPGELPRIALFDHGGRHDFYNVVTAVDVDRRGRPFVFTNRDRGEGEELELWTWSGTSWSQRALGLPRVAPFEAVSDGEDGALVYAIERRRRVARLTFADDRLVADDTLYEIPRNDYRLAHLTFVRHGTPEARGFFFHGLFGPWTDPTPTGSLLTFPE